MAARTGGCLCGAVRYESAGEPLFSLLCHCRDCQHQSGSAFIAAMRVRAAGFRITKGEPKLFVSASDAGNAVTRAFCPECGCPLFIRVSARPDLVATCVGTFGDPSWSHMAESLRRVRFGRPHERDGRPRHVVLVRAMAARDPRLARADPRARPLLPG